MLTEDGYCSSDSPPVDSDEQTAASPEESMVESPHGDQKPVHSSPSPSSPPPAKRSRRSVQKRVVSVPIADTAGSGDRPKGAGEGPPPSDSWAWRKYGQKPIKGSPYPRGYYRCSSSKGCPARKQVERSRLDPTMLVVTYSFDHNHPWPMPKNHSHPNKPVSRPPAEAEPAVQPEIMAVQTEPAELEPEQEHKFVGLIEPELMTAAPAVAADDDDDSFHWFDHEVASTSSNSMLYGPLIGALDVAPLQEECEGDLQGEDALFAGLGELPECAVVFGRRREFGLAATGPWCS